MKTKTVCLLIPLLVLLSFLATAEVNTTPQHRTLIRVPEDASTIQAGIDLAVDGDTVLVSPNTYFENIRFKGKKIIVSSLFLSTQDNSYVSSTIIDGTKNGSVVTFDSGEDSAAKLIGFTIQNGNIGWNEGEGGGGILCLNSSNPCLTNLVIKDNSSFNHGGGILCEDSSPYISNCTIKNNSCNDDGGGISCLLNSLPYTF